MQGKIFGIKGKLSRPAAFGIYVILIVEDDPKEAEKGIKAVKEKGCVCSSASLTAPIGAVSTLEELREHLDHPKVVWDGVITDLYLTDEPVGLAVAAECKSRGIPCVICTDRYRHAESQWWYKVAEELGAEVEVRKDWNAAVEKLIALIEKKKALLVEKKE